MNCSIHNFRDISGYTNRDGKTMKKNMIFRGGAVTNLSKEECDYFENQLGIKYVLDFRDKMEADLNKDQVFGDIVYERIGALKVEVHDDNGFDIASIMKTGMNADSFKMIIEYLKEGYSKMPLDNDAYRKLFELLLRNDGHVYFHCTAGKDRTGVAGFLIMMALGMSEEDAICEYMKSNECLKDVNDSLAKQLNISDEYKEMCMPLLGVSEEFILMSIKSIKDKYESYDEFFEKEYGLDKEKRDGLVKIYCE